MWRESNKARRHEKQDGHREKAKYYSPPESSMNRHVAHASRAEEVIGPLAEVLASWESAGGRAPPTTASTSEQPAFVSESFGGNDLDMDVIMNAFVDDLSSSADLTKARMSQSLLDYMNGEDIYTDSEPENDAPIFDDFPTGKITSILLLLIHVLMLFDELMVHRRSAGWRTSTPSNEDDAR